MGFSTPKFIDSKGRSTVASAAASGSSDNFVDWTDLPLDPTDGWTITKGDMATAASATAAKVGSELHFTLPASLPYRIQGSEMRGIFMARSIHLKPWEETGVPMPAGQVANQFQPEQFQLKIEVEFATSNGGPISGGTVAGADGQYLTCLAGLAGYTTDQGGNPNTTGYLWSAAQVQKAAGGDPASSTNINMYKSGYKSYFTNSGISGNYTWKNMQSPPEGAHNAIVYVTSPMRKGNTNEAINIQAGSYANDVPFLPMATLGQQLLDNSTKFSNQSIQKFWHIAIWVGTHTNTGGMGQVKIAKIRYALTPIVGRAPLT